MYQETINANEETFIFKRITENIMCITTIFLIFDICHFHFLLLIKKIFKK